MSEFINAVRSAWDGGLDGVSDAVILAMGVVCLLSFVLYHVDPCAENREKSAKKGV